MVLPVVADTPAVRPLKRQLGRAGAEDPVEDLGDDLFSLLAHTVAPVAGLDGPETGREDGQVLDGLAAREQRPVGVLRQHLLLEQLDGHDCRASEAMRAQDEAEARLEHGRDVVAVCDL